MSKKNYIEIQMVCEPSSEAINSIVIAELAEIGYDSFVENDECVSGYIIEDVYDPKRVETLIKDFPLEVNLTYTTCRIPDQNWNEEWEKNYFSPIIIENECVIKSSFHKDVPDCKYNIFINPKMAFGTGHHQTTILMLKEILKDNFEGQAVLDMGCGTAILSILASMRNAKDVTAIDIDQWAYDNAVENIELNNIQNVTVSIGGAELLEYKKFDSIIANINRNILLEDMHIYAAVLNTRGKLYMSGFYVEDLTMIKEEAKKNKLNFEYYTAQDNWAGVKFTKL